MLLRESGEQQGTVFDLATLVEGGDASGVSHGSALLAFAECVVMREPVETARARATVVDQMGVEAMVDAAAVAANFERMVRIADATGITLGERLAEPTAQVRADLGLDRFASTAG